MSLSHSPLIVRDGLVLCLDAANPRSYPKSGTTWSDLKGSNDGTLTNMGASNFDSANGGTYVCFPVWFVGGAEGLARGEAVRYGMLTCAFIDAIATLLYGFHGEHLHMLVG